MDDPVHWIGFRVAKIRPRRRWALAGVLYDYLVSVFVFLVLFCFSFVFLVMLFLFLQRQLGFKRINPQNLRIRK